MLLGIDLGTGSAKALLLATDGTAIGEASSSYPVHAPHPGWAESEPEDWWLAVASAVRKAVGNHADQVQAIALSGQMHGVVLASESGQPLRPAILWADTRSSATLNTYHSLDAAILEPLGNPVTAGMAGPTLLWLREHEATVYTEARWALQPKDWLRLRMTGEVATEPSDASGTLLYDVVSDNWAREAISALNLRGDWLPKIIPSSAIGGYLTTIASEHLGLKVGLPVIAGAADTAAAALGNGLLEPGLVQLTIGTGAQIITPRSQPIIDRHGRTHHGSAKIPKFVLGSLRDQLQLGGAIDYLSLTIAAWCRYLNGYDDQNRPIPIDDPLADSLTQQAGSGKTDPKPLLSIFEIFGDLVQSPRFVETVADKLRSLQEFGAKRTLVSHLAPIHKD